MTPPAMTADDLARLLAAEFPQVFHAGAGGGVEIEAARHGGCRLRRAYSERLLRPGNTISGAAMMDLADLALYVALLATIGPVTLAVTTNFTASFLRRPARRDLIADCTLLKVGKRLATGEVALRSDGNDEIVCHAVGTYSIPAGQVR